MTTVFKAIGVILLIGTPGSLELDNIDEIKKAL